MNPHHKAYNPYISPFDPCPPIQTKTYSTPPHLYMGFQPLNLEQFTPAEALRAGTLWKPFFDPYFSPHELAKGGGQS
ncbi:spore coat associated protein CotJA [Neobacillus terrae]|jgi:spore coat protein JA|uniref:spore coat associated protein CotJA n=1 Tax=Neobacillus terrae TaxID=3034837 RepID=UPI0004235448|nr:spore coat associated protein CotJA [Neobacillus terrae]NHM29093.1 spore coat associated protein CotJA [Neobacillus terrae]